MSTLWFVLKVMAVKGSSSLVVDFVRLVMMGEERMGHMKYGELLHESLITWYARMFSYFGSSALSDEHKLLKEGVDDVFWTRYGKVFDALYFTQQFCRDRGHKSGMFYDDFDVVGVECLVPSVLLGQASEAYKSAGWFLRYISGVGLPPSEYMIYQCVVLSYKLYGTGKMISSYGQHRERYRDGMLSKWIGDRLFSGIVQREEDVEAFSGALLSMKNGLG